MGSGLQNRRLLFATEINKAL